MSEPWIYIVPASVLMGLLGFVFGRFVGARLVWITAAVMLVAIVLGAQYVIADSQASMGNQGLFSATIVMLTFAILGVIPLLVWVIAGLVGARTSRRARVPE